MEHVLVTGGAGYIGSFMVKRLLDLGFKVSVIDNLSRGQKIAVDERANFFEGNILDSDFLTKVFNTDRFDAVIHFAGLISVGESVKNPDNYYRNNTMGSFCLLEIMRLCNVNRIIFSSTAAIYGNPQKLPIPEDHPKITESPYGESKLRVERGLQWYRNNFGINSVSLRYFNASGAALDGSAGEQHQPETHIIPSAIKAVLSNSAFTLFGDDYSTTDGTCVRDYIHVLDLVEAHILALNKLKGNEGAFAYNVGTGNGYTNRQLIEVIERISGKKLNIKIENRRNGDSAVLIADNQMIKQDLGFKPRYSDLQTIVETAWKWHFKYK